MSDINSTTPLGTETTAGVTTGGSDSVLTVLSFVALKRDGFYVEIQPGNSGYWKTSDMIDWRPIPNAGLNATLPCNLLGAFTLQVKRVPNGIDVSDIRAGRIRL